MKAIATERKRCAIILNAKSVLSSAGITAGQSFESLSLEQFAAVRAEAAIAYQQKHRRPLPDNSSSYIRRRYHLLQLRISR